MLDKEQEEKVYGDKKNLTDEQKQQLKEEKKAKKTEAKRNYLNGVKEVLTPEQYVVFLENFYIYTPDNKGKAAIGGKAKMSRGDRPQGPRGSMDGKDKKKDKNKDKNKDKGNK